MTYKLLIFRSDTREDALEALIHCPPQGQAKVITASIDLDQNGNPTPHTFNALRALALSELIITHALPKQQPAEDA